jgi:WD40 repeat protein
MHWLRGTWRQARRGNGRVVFLSGPAGIGKTRLIAELANELARTGEHVEYAGPGGAAVAVAMQALRTAATTLIPTLLVLDDLEVIGDGVVRALLGEWPALASRPVMLVGVVADPAAATILADAVARADAAGDGHVALAPLDLAAVESIARSYVGDDVRDLPLESIARASGGSPGRIHELVSEWARDEAGRRLTAAAEWLAEGRERRTADLDFANNVIGLRLGRLYDADGVAADETACPYKGLASFDATDAEYFFGRERLVGELAARTVRVGLLGVVGASGSGKSSAVAAGLLPSLRAGLLPGSERWRQVSLRPGEHPVAELAAQVGPDLEAALAAGQPDDRLVLAVDQFEEVFTLCADVAERSTFIDTIARAANTWPERFVVVLTIRDDLYGRCAAYPALAELLGGNHVLVGPMTREELRRAIELPARRARLRIESGLVDALVEEIAGEPGGLPLLSTTLVELWQTREDDWLRLDAYHRAGGVRGAVARLAEASYEQLTHSENDAARRLFLRLAGTSDTGTVTRRRVSLAELDLDADPITAGVLTRLAADRLLTTSDSTVEVAHEALLREWPRFQDWLADDRQGHLLRQRLTHAAKQWDDNGEDPSELYRGALLSAALEWASTHGSDLNQVERAFLAASHQASERDAERQRRTNRRLRALLTGAVVFLVVALLAGGVALVQRGHAKTAAHRAETQASIATARELTEAALANLSIDPDRSILLALRAVETYRALGGAVPEDAVEALHKAAENSRLLVTLSDPATGSVAFSPDGKLLATAGYVDHDQGRVMLRDARTGQRLRTVVAPDDDIEQVRFSPDGSRLLTRGTTAGGMAVLQLWDARSGAKLRTLHPAGVVKSAAFSPDGQRVAAATLAGTLTIYDVRSAKSVLQVTNPGPLCSVDFSPDASMVAAAACYAGTTAPIWDARTGQQLAAVGGYGSVIAVAFSPDSRRLVTGGIDGVARVWNVGSSRLVSTLRGHTGWIYAVAFSPDGRQVATGSGDGTARVWDAGSGRQLITLAAHIETVHDVAFAPDGAHLATASSDHTTRIWDVTPLGARDVLTIAAGKAVTPSLLAQLSPDGTRLVTGAGDAPTAALWNATTGKRLATLPVERDFADIRYSPDGTRILLVGDGTPAVVDSSLQHVLFRLQVSTPSDAFMGGAWSRDGTLIAVGDGDGRAILVDARTGRSLRTFVHSTDAQCCSGAVYRVAFSPDGTELATADWDKTVKLWDVHTGALLRTIVGHTDQVNAVAFSPDGRRLLTASSDGLAKVWALPAGHLLTTLTGHAGAIWDAEFSPDGKAIATAGDDTTARLWNAATGRQELELTGSQFSLYDVDFSADAKRLVTASGDGTVRLYALPLDELMSVARHRLTRSWAPAECPTYLHTATCPSSP